MSFSVDILTGFVRKARQGDLSAQALLYRQYAQAMYNICIRMTGTKEEAEDILHDAFMIAFKNLKQLKEDRTFSSWFKTIVINECIRVGKKRMVWEEVEEIPADLADTDSSWMANIRIEVIHSEVKKLPEGCRQVFNLFAIEDLAHKKIAELLNISESTSKTQYLRAKKLLRERLQKINNG